MLTEIANAANVHPACRSYVDASFCRQKRVPTQTGSHRGLWIIWSLSWDISKTLQLTRKQSWRINSATGVRENMYVGLRLLLSKHSRFFGHSRNQSNNLSATKAKIKPCVSSCRMSGPEDGQQRDLTWGGAGGERRRGVTTERAEGTSDERGGERDERGTAVCTSRRRCFDCVTTTVWRRICSAASVETGLKLWCSFSWAYDFKYSDFKETVCRKVNWTPVKSRAVCVD